MTLEQERRILLERHGTHRGTWVWAHAPGVLSFAPRHAEQGRDIAVIYRDKPMDLRPLDYGGIIDRTVELYRKNFVLFVSVVAVVYVPLAVLQLTLQSAPLRGNAGAMAGLGTLVGLLSVIAGLCAQGALTVAVSRRYLGMTATVGECFQTLNTRMGALILTSVLCAFLVGLGCLLFLIPGIVFMFWIVFASPVVVLENRSGPGAIERSKFLVGQGEWVRVLVLGILCLLMGIVAGIPLGMVVQALSAAGPVVITLAQTAMQVVIHPIGLIAFTILYYDIRVRKEGFDLQVLATHLGAQLPEGHLPAAPPAGGGWGTPAAPPAGGGGWGTPAAPPAGGGGWGTPASPPAGDGNAAWGASVPSSAAPTQGAWSAPSSQASPSWGGSVSPPSQAPGGWGAPAPPAAPLPRYCTSCGVALAAPSPFCPSCGQQQGLPS